MRSVLKPSNDVLAGARLCSRSILSTAAFNPSTKSGEAARSITVYPSSRIRAACDWMSASVSMAISLLALCRALRKA